MSETRILIRLLRMYFPRNWEFSSALTKLRNFGGRGLEPPKHPSVRHCIQILGYRKQSGQRYLLVMACTGTTSPLTRRFYVSLTVHLQLYSYARIMNQHDALFFTLFRYYASTCFGLMFSPSSGGQVYNVAMVLLLLLNQLSAGQ
jgi:hypothetical protein